MEIKFSDQCIDVLRGLEISQSLVKDACQDRTRGMIVPGKPMQMYATSWMQNDSIVYSNGLVTRAEKEGDRLHIQEVTLQLALELRENLPAGTILPNMNMKQILAVIVESFGLKIRINPNEPPTRLYDGTWQGNAFSPSMMIEFLPDDMCFFTGVFNNDDRTCHYVWAFSYNKYKTWFVEG